MGYRLTKIYTRSGDDGKTNLGDKNRLAKNSLRVEALGTLDELNCAIGCMLSQPGCTESIHQFFTQIQHEIFNIGGELCPPYHPVITSEKIVLLEKTIDKWNEELEPLQEFVLPQGNSATTSCHLARAICRRAERCLVALNQEEKLRPEILQYINRLSDVLFVAARILTKANQEHETLWDHQKKSDK